MHIIVRHHNRRSSNKSSISNITCNSSARTRAMAVQPPSAQSAADVVELLQMLI
jgi:hypothetical protein